MYQGAKFSDDPIRDEIKSRVSILDLCGYSNGRVPCPIRDCLSFGSGKRDTQVSDDFWFCHICKRGGDVFEWVANADGVTYATARRSLAERLGIALKPAKSRTEILRKVVVAAHHYLFSKPEKLAYLTTTRGIPRSVCLKHLIGYVDANGSVLEDSGVTHEDLLSVGLYYPARATGEGDLSVMAGRFVFPIRDIEGRIIQLKGRADPTFWTGDVKKSIPLQKQPPLAPREWGSYSHLNHLYLEETLKAVKPKDYVIVAEGEPDTLTLQALGFNAVGLQTSQGMGRHAFKLKEFKTIYVMLDNDVASQRMITNELYELQIRLPGSTVKLVQIPKLDADKKIDVNDYVVKLKMGSKDVQSLLDKSVAAYTHIAREWGPLYVDRDVLNKLSALLTACPKPMRGRLLDLLSETTGKKKELLAFALDPGGES